LSDYRCHSRVSFYVVYKGRDKPQFISNFLDPERAQDWVSGRNNHYYRDKRWPVAGYIAKIDGIEYQISKTREGDMAEAIKDSIKLHEAFYEDEYKTGKIKSDEAVKKAKGGWYVLRGAAHTGGKLVSTGRYRFKNDKTMQYAKSKHFDQIINAIIWAGTYDDRKLDGMTLTVPGGKIVQLPDLDDIVRQPNFYEELKEEEFSGETYWSILVTARENEVKWKDDTRKELTDIMNTVLADEK